MQQARRILIALFVLAAPLGAQTPRLQPVASGFVTPILAVHAPGDPSRLFVVQQNGYIRYTAGGAASDLFLDIDARVSSGGERGLLGMAFHPDYASNGYFYLNYTATVASQLVTRIARFSALGDPLTSVAADPGSELILLEFNQDFSNHNGGMIAFGPLDGYLYVATGDGGSGNDPNGRGQSLDTLLGKMLRIDVDKKPGNIDAGPHSIPDDNPFAGKGTGARGEIWAYGLRNPWRFSFDSVAADLWIGDVGQNAREEIDFQPASSGGGENYGWRVFEGTRCNTTVEPQAACDTLIATATAPVHEYPNPGDGRAVTGGHVYRGGEFPGLVGTYFFGDSSSNRIWSFAYAGGVKTDFQEWTATLDPTGGLLSALVSFGESPGGTLYLVDIGGTVYRLSPVLERHSADQDGDNRISLSEVLRVIQIYNRGGYYCEPGSEDGYNVTGGPRLCTPHASDYAPQDWQVAISELLRAIQLYNTGPFTPCPEGEDGFCIPA